ncbi:MAG: hypothetical protein J6Y24_12840 [Bacteroidales bacterium]|nr:hypothetical protein [Bacteroidales bacterium]
MRKLLLLMSLVLAFAVASAQKTEKVSWTYSYNPLDNGNVELFFNANIADGYHLYSPYNPAGGAQPLKIELTESSDYSRVSRIVEVIKPTEQYSKVFNKNEKFFAKKAQFKMIVKPTDGTPFTVTGSIKGQACDDGGTCIMVRKSFTINVK